MSNKQKLDIASEFFVLSTYGNTKNVIVMACEFQGLMDEQAIEQAYLGTLTTYPHIHSRLEHFRKWGQSYFARVSKNELGLGFHVSNLSLEDPSEPVFDAMMERLRPLLDREWDLFREPPLRLEVMRIAPDRWLTALLIHHSVGDGGTCTNIAREMIGQYHTIVTGNQPDWLFNPYVFSTHQRRRRVAKRRIPWGVAWNDVFTELRDMAGKSVVPIGHGTRGDTGEHHVKRVLSENDTVRLSQSRGQRTAPLVDRLIAATNFALDHWNDLRGQPPGMITTAVTVSTKHRFEIENDFINISVSVLRTNPEERADPVRFLRYLALARTKFFRGQGDVRFMHRLTWLTNQLRLLPLKLRQRIYHAVCERHRYSLSVTFMGVVWPGLENGRLTHETCVTHAGGAEIVEVHGTNYKPAASAYINFLCYVFRNRLNIVVSAKAAHLSKGDCREFLDLTVEKLMLLSP